LVAAEVFRAVDSSLTVSKSVRDGDSVAKMQRVVDVQGNAASILKAERTALNFLCHLSGIATHTHLFVEAVRPWGTVILCTRKTTPGLRRLEVEAVRHGGGDAYRTNLSDAILLKDNHTGILGGMPGIHKKLADIMKKRPSDYDELLRKGKIEASSLEDVEAAVEMGWGQILLDNFSPAEVAEAVHKWGKRVFLEMSGGVNLDNVRQYAATGVHAISIGAITHSSKAMDFSLEVDWRHS
ncbi:carboxylating nicotinate-nucleotide diphosphorylase, partial [candidate division KSB1 bacterium]